MEQGGALSHEATEPRTDFRPHPEQFGGPWAIAEDRFAEFAAFLRCHAPTLEAIELLMIAPPAAPSAQVTADGIAVLDISGPITKHGGWWGPGASDIRGLIDALAVDEKIVGAVMRIDSPGGNVAGVGDVAAAAANFNRSKPLVTFGEDLVASAAYLIASQGGKFMATADTLVGSIGVYSVVQDWSAFFAQAGVKVHVIRGGAMKGAGVWGTEVTPEQLADLQRTVDQFHKRFVAAVAGGRHMSMEQAGALADGRIHIASVAKEMGLIDEVGSFQDAIIAARHMAAERQRMKMPPRAAGPRTKEKTMGTETTDKPQAATPAQLKKTLPDSNADFREEMQELGATLEEAKDFWIAAQAKAAVAAAQRIAQLEAADAQHVADLKAAAKKPGVAPVASGGVTRGTSGDPVADWNEAVDAEVAKGKPRDAAVRRVNETYPGLREEMIAAHNQKHPRGTGAAPR